MTDLAETIGWVGNACFFSRFAIQWFVSEKAKRTVTPPVFWWLSLAGATLTGTAAFLMGLWLLLPAFVINSVIYARNLTFGEGRSRLGLVQATLIGAVVATALVYLGYTNNGWKTDVGNGFLVAGVIGQAIWSTRWLLQWWLSERSGASHLPVVFWWLSFVGAWLNIAYASQLDTWVYVVGFMPSWFVPMRNLMLERRRRTAARGAA
ncbi:MAG: lipid-A-disaccharide synthase N-terminal domain-containing protein [Planctomycetota bacterium]|nr:lipid-A-disaccharide synthase N-terminal domain-containing protein [Planctomycetota bacterium]